MFSYVRDEELLKSFLADDKFIFIASYVFYKCDLEFLSENCDSAINCFEYLKRNCVHNGSRGMLLDMTMEFYSTHNVINLSEKCDHLDISYKDKAYTIFDSGINAKSITPLELIIIKTMSTYVVIDIESNGLCFERDDVILLQALKIECGRILDTLSINIKPNHLLSKEVEIITKITNEQLQDCRNAKEVLPTFNDFVGHLPIVCMNKSFILGFLQKYSTILVNIDFSELLDVVELAESIFVKEKHLNVQKLSSLFKVKISDNDVLFVYKIFEKIKTLIAAIKSNTIDFSLAEINEIKSMDKITTVSIQRKFLCGYPKAKALIDYLNTCNDES